MNIKLSFADYTYTNARVSAKRAKLLDKGDYENLLKMQSNEIARNLEEEDYRQEINELGSRYEGVELVELALNRNLSRTLSHLLELAPEELEEVLKTYLRRYDIKSLKRLLRWKKSGHEIDIQDMMVPAGDLDYEELEELAEKEFHDIIDAIHFKDSRVDYQSYLEGKKELPEIEKALDQAYFDELEMLASRAGSRQFRKFVEKEMKHENLRTVLRLKKYGFDYDETREYLFSDGDRRVEEVARAGSMEDALNIVRKEEKVDGDNLEEIEHALETRRLEEALKMAHAEPLGITPILGYVIAKIVEVRNLRVLMRAKETEIQKTEDIRQSLVTA